MNDAGLLAAKSDLPLQAVISKNQLFTEFKGALTEQYVLQQLVSDAEIIPYYYSAENSRCEVDFLIQAETGYIPLEVKAEENLRAKSLRVFQEKYKPEISVRTSMSDYRREDWIVNIPLYCLNKHLWELCGISDPNSLNI